MKKYVRVMDGLKSNANGFEYKLDEVNVSKKWDPSTLNPKEMGGFNFSTEDKILRWLHRGTMIYDVMIPEDAEIVLCDEEKGIYRANKIIVTNPRNITDGVVMDLYRKTKLSNKIIAQCLLTLLFKNRLQIVKFIIKDRVNMNNIDEIVSEFENYASNGKFKCNELEDFKTVHDILKEIQSDLYINLYIDKKPYVKKITNDKVINITGESGSGKSYYSNKYLKDDNYIIIDTDIIFSDKPSDNKESLDLRRCFKGESKDLLITDFDKCYLKILNYFKESKKTIVIDSAQYRNIKDYNILKGEVIVIRTCIDNCYKRCLDRYDLENKTATLENRGKFANKKLGMYEWYKSLNSFIEQVDKF